MIDYNMEQYRIQHPKCKFCIYFKEEAYRSWDHRKISTYECILKKEKIKNKDRKADRCIYYSINKEE